MGKINVIISVCLLATVCFGQEETTYNNPNCHFSFDIPEGWEVIDVNDLPDENRESLRYTFSKPTVALCQKLGAEYFTTPCIYIQFRASKDIKEDKLHTLFSLDIGKGALRKGCEDMIQALQKAEGCLPKSWKGAKRIDVKVDYDKDRYISYETAKLYHDKVGHIISVAVKPLGSHRMVTFHCFADGEDTKNFRGLVNQIINSFSYEKGYGFGEDGGPASGFKRILSRKVLYWTVPTVVIFVLLFVLERWARG